MAIKHLYTNSWVSFLICLDMSSTAFIEPLPVIEFVAQILSKDILSMPLCDADRIKVCFYFMLRGLVMVYILVDSNFCMHALLDPLIDYLP